MRALSIRQPFAELILRGVKTVEYRSRPTRIVGERFWIYASRQKAVGGGQGIWSRDFSTGGTPVPQWMLELAMQVGMIEPELRANPGLLPTGVIVGSAVIERVTPVTPPHPGPLPGGEVMMWRWHLSSIERAERLRKPTGRPQPVWFRPF